MDDPILEKLQSIEQQLDQLQEQGRRTFQFFNKALSNDKKTKQKNLQSKNIILEQIYSDPDIRYPHQKIIQYLLNQYDYETKQYKKVYFSKLVKETRIGKNKANEYFSLLMDKGLLQRSTDGYKVFYEINDET